MTENAIVKGGGDAGQSLAAEKNEVKIFVGNLPFTSSKDEIASLFSKYGTVIGVNIREDRLTGKPKGFGFVTFTEESHALAAIAGMHDKQYEGRPLTVKPAEKRGTKDKDSEKEAKPWITRPPARKVELTVEQKEEISRRGGLDIREGGVGGGGGGEEKEEFEVAGKKKKKAQQKKKAGEGAGPKSWTDWSGPC